MKRRTFIKNSALGAAAISTPFILPSGRLFAATGNRMADHVVFVAFAGGVRQQESVLQRYLDDRQEYPSAGNIMYNIFEGATPTDKIVYGPTGSVETPIYKLLTQTLQSQGTLFKEVNASTVGHYAGVNTLLTGNYMYSQGLRNKPSMPTIFEYLRRHQGEKATKTWFIGNGIGNSIPLLDYSLHPDYGSQFGANFLAPTITFGDDGEKHLKNAKIYHPEDELEPMYKMKYFLDNVWYSQGKPLPNIGNTEQEKAEIKQFVKDMFEKKGPPNTIAHPPDGAGSDDGPLHAMSKTVCLLLAPALNDSESFQKKIKKFDDCDKTSSCTDGLKKITHQPQDPPYIIYHAPKKSLDEGDTKYIRSSVVAFFIEPYSKKLVMFFAFKIQFIKKYDKWIKDIKKY